MVISTWVDTAKIGSGATITALFDSFVIVFDSTAVLLDALTFVDTPTAWLDTTKITSSVWTNTA